MRFRLFTVFLVGFATAFNTFNINVGGRPLSVGLFAVALYFLSIVILPLKTNIGKYISRRGLLIMVPLLYTFLLTMMNMFFDNGSAAIFPFAFFMDWILYLALLIHSVDDNRAIDYCLYGLSIGAIILSILFFFGIGVELNLTREGSRLSMFGSNENVLGIFQSISSCIILNLFIFYDRLRLGLFKWIFLIPLFLSASMIFATGSRTALLVLIAEYGVSIWTYNFKKKFIKYIIVVSSSIVFVIIAFFLFNSDSSSESSMALRMLSTVEEGNTGGRTDIWISYLKYFPEHPWFGVGNSGLIDIAKVSGVGTSDITGSVTALSPHNVLVEVLMTTGLVGLLMMLCFWINTFRAAIVTLVKYKYSTPLILLIPIVAVIVSGQILGEKYAWIIYAYMLAASLGMYHRKEIKASHHYNYVRRYDKEHRKRRKIRKPSTTVIGRLEQ